MLTGRITYKIDAKDIKETLENIPKTCEIIGIGEARLNCFDTITQKTK